MIVKMNAEYIRNNQRNKMAKNTENKINSSEYSFSNING